MSDADESPPADTPPSTSELPQLEKNYRHTTESAISEEPPELEFPRKLPSPAIVPIVKPDSRSLDQDRYQDSDGYPEDELDLPKKDQHRSAHDFPSNHSNFSMSSFSRSAQSQSNSSQSLSPIHIQQTTTQISRSADSDSPVDSESTRKKFVHGSAMAGNRLKGKNGINHNRSIYYQVSRRTSASDDDDTTDTDVTTDQDSDEQDDSYLDSMSEFSNISLRLTGASRPFRGHHRKSSVEMIRGYSGKGPLSSSSSDDFDSLGHRSNSKHEINMAQTALQKGPTPSRCARCCMPLYKFLGWEKHHQRLGSDLGVSTRTEFSWKRLAVWFFLLFIILLSGEFLTHLIAFHDCEFAKLTGNSSSLLRVLLMSDVNILGAHDSCWVDRFDTFYTMKHMFGIAMWFMSTKPDLMIQLGDATDEGHLNSTTSSEFFHDTNMFYNALDVDHYTRRNSYGIPLINVPGDHDIGANKQIQTHPRMLRYEKSYGSINQTYHVQNISLAVINSMDYQRDVQDYIKTVPNNSYWFIHKDIDSTAYKKDILARRPLHIFSGSQRMFVNNDKISGSSASQSIIPTLNYRQAGVFSALPVNGDSYNSDQQIGLVLLTIGQNGAGEYQHKLKYCAAQPRYVPLTFYGLIFLMIILPNKQLSKWAFALWVVLCVLGIIFGIQWTWAKITYGCIVVFLLWWLLSFCVKSVWILGLLVLLYSLSVVLSYGAVVGDRWWEHI